MENLASLIRLVLLTVDGQTYALHLETVGRILRMAEITPLPGAPDAAEGVVNVQGEVVPSSVVHGMPGAAIKLDAATFILPTKKIAAVLTSVAHNRK